MSFLLAMLTKLGELVTRLAPYFLAYKAGSSAKQHDFDESIKQVLREDNEKLNNIVAMSDHAVADKLRDRAAQKRKDQD